MPHTLILGITQYGKTTLGKQLAAHSMKKKRRVIVLDPMYAEWQCSFRTADQATFLQTVWANESCDVFVDEAGAMIGHYEDTMIQLATQGLHWGHNCFFITQDSKTISPVLRGMCTGLYCFALARERVKDLAIEWNKPALLEVTNYPPGVCMWVGRKPGEIKHFNVFN